MTDNDEERTPGDPAAPEHDAFLMELGRATYTAARVAGVCFDLLRVLGATPSHEMYEDPLGTLQSRLRGLAKRRPDVSDLPEFLEKLDGARRARNDLLHAFPVRDGLYRRTAPPEDRIRELFTVESLNEITRQLDETARLGNAVLYFDDGASVRAWYDAGGS